eukprot:6481425-Lingulodinium_polyedra.AAC.1
MHILGVRRRARAPRRANHGNHQAARTPAASRATDRQSPLGSRNVLGNARISHAGRDPQRGILP